MINSNNFPLDSFCPEFQAMAQNIASTYNCNTDWIYSTMLAVAGFSFEHKYEAHIKTDWVERSNLWLILTGDSGTSKSPVLNALTKSIFNKNTALKIEYIKRNAIFKDYTQQLKTNDVLKGSPEPSAMREFCFNTYGSGIVPTKPNNVRCMTEKTTFEKLHLNLSDECNNRRPILIRYDEIIGLLKSFDQYGKGANYEDFLKLKDYQGTTVERMDEAKTFIVPEKNVAVIGGTQFNYMFDIMNDTNRKSGLAYRFLYAIDNETKFTNIITKIKENRITNRFDNSYANFNDMIDYFMLDYDCEVNRTDLKVCNECLDFIEQWNEKINVAKVNIDSKVYQTITAKALGTLTQIAIIINRTNAYFNSKLNYVDLYVSDYEKAANILEYFINNTITLLNLTEIQSNRTFNSTSEMDCYENMTDNIKCQDLVNQLCFNLKCSDKTARRILIKWQSENLIKKNSKGQYYKLK